MHGIVAVALFYASEQANVLGVVLWIVEPNLMKEATQITNGFALGYKAFSDLHDLDSRLGYFCVVEDLLEIKASTTLAQKI